MIRICSADDLIDNSVGSYYQKLTLAYHDEYYTVNENRKKLKNVELEVKSLFRPRWQFEYTFITNESKYFVTQSEYNELLKDKNCRLAKKFVKLARNIAEIQDCDLVEVCLFV